MIPVVDAFRCNGCGICVKRCPPQIMGLVKGIAVLITDLCEECGICAEVCPVDGVRFELPHLEFEPKHDAYQPLAR